MDPTYRGQREEEGKGMKLGPSKLKSRGSMMAAGGNGRKRPYGMLLLVAMMAVLLSVVTLHKLRERRVFGIVLQEREGQLLALQLVLQKEREHSKELKRRLDDMKAQALSLRTQKMDLSNKLMETEATAFYLKEKQGEMETALNEKQNQINMLTDGETESIKTNLRISALADLLKQREGELEEIKQRLSPPENTTTAENVGTGNETGKTNDEDATSKNVQLESDEGRATTEQSQVGNSIETADSLQLKNLEREQQVKLETNIGNEGTIEQHGTEVSGDQQLEKPVVSQESEHREGSESSQEAIIENQSTVDQDQTLVSRNQQLKKLAVSQESEHPEVGEISHKSLPNNQNTADQHATQASRNKQPEKPVVSQESDHQEGDEKSRKITREITEEEDSEMVASTQHDKEQVVPEVRLEGTTKLEEQETRVEQGNRKRTRRHRRKRVVRKGDLVKQNNEQSENSQNGEILSLRYQNADISILGTNKEGTISNNGQSQIRENPQATDTKDQALLHSNGRGQQSQDGEVSTVDEVKRTEGGTDIKENEAQNAENLSATSQTNSSGETEAQEERPVSKQVQVQTLQANRGSVSLQSKENSFFEMRNKRQKTNPTEVKVTEKTQNDKGQNKNDESKEEGTDDSAKDGKGSVERQDQEVIKETEITKTISGQTEANNIVKGNEGKNLIENAQEGETTESTEGKTVMSEESKFDKGKKKVDENNIDINDSSIDEKDDEEVIKETAVATTTSKPELTEAGSIAEDLEKQMSRDKTEKANNFSVHDTKGNDGELKKNAKNSNSDDVSEF